MKIDESKYIRDKDINKSVSVKKNTNMLLAAFIMFIFPIISIFVGVFIGGFVGQTIEASITISQVIGGIAGFGVAAMSIKLFDKYSKVDENSKKIEWDDL